MNRVVVKNARITEADLTCFGGQFQFVFDLDFGNQYGEANELKLDHAKIRWSFDIVMPNDFKFISALRRILDSRETVIDTTVDDINAVVGSIIRVIILLKDDADLSDGSNYSILAIGDPIDNLFLCVHEWRRNNTPVTLLTVKQIYADLI